MKAKAEPFLLRRLLLTGRAGGILKQMTEQLPSKVTG